MTRQKLDLDETRSHLITTWLNGEKRYLKSPMYLLNDGYVLERLWVSFDACLDLHQAANFPLLPFDSARDRGLKYLIDACALLNRQRPGFGLPPTERELVTSELGQPPHGSYSIYMITVSQLDGAGEKVVYIGKTNATSHRFSAGHAAFSKLHHPRFYGLAKKIYFGCVTAMNDDEHYIPVEWLNETLKRDAILSDVENELIFDLQPILNSKGKGTRLAVNPLPTTVENKTGRKFLDGHDIDPPEE